LFLTHKFASISFFSLLDTNHCAMNNSHCFACLQISVKFQIPPSKSVKRQVLDTSYIFSLGLDVKTCHYHENSGLLASDADWLEGFDFLMF
jgi:hypothetical protein